MTASVAAAVVLLLAVSAARADDLLILNGDSVTLSGSRQYGLVYVDGDMRLAGDTSISANSIYIGPNAYRSSGSSPAHWSASRSSPARWSPFPRRRLHGGTGSTCRRSTCRGR